MKRIFKLGSNLCNSRFSKLFDLIYKYDDHKVSGLDVEKNMLCDDIQVLNWKRFRIYLSDLQELALDAWTWIYDNMEEDKYYD